MGTFLLPLLQFMSRLRPRPQPLSMTLTEICGKIFERISDLPLGVGRQGSYEPGN